MTRSADRFRIGIVGAGFVSDGYHVPVLRQMADVTIAWVCDLDEDKARRFAREHHVPVAARSLEGLPAVDAALVAIPVGARREVLDTAFARGWHLFVEKPFAVSTAEHQRILDKARRVGVQVFVGLMRRFYRPVLEARSLLRSGLFGPVREIWAAEGSLTRGSGRGDDWYQADPGASGGGVVAETGSHLIDQALFIADATDVGEPKVETTVCRGLDLDSRFAAAACRTGQLEPFQLYVAVSRLRDLNNAIVLRCDRATIKVGLSFDGAVEFLDHRYVPLRALRLQEQGANGIYQAFSLQWRAFVAQCREGVPSDADAASALVVTKVIDSVYAATTREVTA